MATVDDELGRALDARIEAIAAEAQTIEHVPTATIAPDTAGGPVHAAPRAIEVLRAMPSGGAAVEMRAPIGRGGMGIVYVGTQLALGREVAIKLLRDEIRSEHTTLKLLREAWITGSLEHPNVVPVYDLSLDDSGSPRIVLKKISGEAWSNLMHARALLKEREGVVDPLEWNIRILLQVCNAISFAHSRGIVHRDLKPDNVMIGEFGEVYLLDWGIAVALEDDGTGRLPLAKDATDLAGTPAYLAPEMMGGEPSRIGPRTDIYLLGALLFEIIVGRPPHEGGSFLEMLASVARSEPALPEGTPAELARIVRRAMQREPEARYESAEQLRGELFRYLEHRSSLQLAADAERRLRALEEERAKPIGDADDARLRLYHVFGECRFGFLEALQIWHENEIARAGLRRALELMIELELDQGDPKAAALLMGELVRPSGELRQRVNDARRAKEREEASRDAMARDLDRSVGRRTRLLVSTTLGVMWTILPWIGFFMERADPTIDQRMPILSSAITLVIASALGYWARSALARTALNRSLVRAVAAVLAGQLALFAVTWRLGVSYESTRPLVLLLYAVCASLTAAAIEKRLWPAAIAMIATFLAGSAWPEYAWPFESFGNLALTINVLVIWGRSEPVAATSSAGRDEAKRRRAFRDFLERKQKRDSLGDDAMR
ncbi:MAG: serine/threonine protein kinase [Myxococcota bacterium]|nr:serine/threonine protein kinase [Myxococcota bacterium]